MASDEIILVSKMAARKKKRRSTILPCKKDIEKYRRYQPKAPPAEPNCRHTNSNLECNRLSQEEVKTFHRKFYYTRDRKLQDAFILRHCEGRTPKSRKSSPRKRHRKVSALYFVSTRERRLRVCRSAFAGILGIKEYRITSLLSKLHSRQDPQGQPSRSILSKRNTTPKKTVTFAKTFFYKSFRDNTITLSSESEIKRSLSSDGLLNTAKHTILEQDLENISDLSDKSEHRNTAARRRRRRLTEVPKLDLDDDYPLGGGISSNHENTLEVENNHNDEIIIYNICTSNENEEPQKTESDDFTNTANTSTQFTENEGIVSMRVTAPTNDEKLNSKLSDRLNRVIKTDQQLKRESPNNVSNVPFEQNTEQDPPNNSTTTNTNLTGTNDLQVRQNTLNVTYDIISNDCQTATNTSSSNVRPCNKNTRISTGQLTKKKTYLDLHTLDKATLKKWRENQFFIFQMESNIKMQRKLNEPLTNTTSIKKPVGNRKSHPQGNGSNPDKDKKEILLKKLSCQALPRSEKSLSKKTTSCQSKTLTSTENKTKLANMSSDSGKNLKSNPAKGGAPAAVTRAKHNVHHLKTNCDKENIKVSTFKSERKPCNDSFKKPSQNRQTLTNRKENALFQTVTSSCNSSSKKEITETKKMSKVLSKHLLTKNNSGSRTSKTVSNDDIQREKKSIPQEENDGNGNLNDSEVPTDRGENRVNTNTSCSDHNVSKDQLLTGKNTCENVIKSSSKDEIFDGSNENKPCNWVDDTSNSKTRRDFTWSEPRTSPAPNQRRANSKVKSGRKFSWSSPKVESDPTTNICSPKCTPFEVLPDDVGADEVSFKHPSALECKNLPKSQYISAYRGSVKNNTPRIMSDYNFDEKENIPHNVKTNSDKTVGEGLSDISEIQMAGKVNYCSDKRYATSVSRLGKRNLPRKTSSMNTSAIQGTRLPLQVLKIG